MYQNHPEEIYSKDPETEYLLDVFKRYGYNGFFGKKEKPFLKYLVLILINTVEKINY